MALSRWPIQSSFCCSCRQRSDAVDPQTSSWQSFLCPAHTWPTEKLPFAPLSNRTSTDARSSTLMSTSSNASIRIGGGKRLARALRLLALRDHRRDVAEHVRDPQAADVLRQIAPVRPDVAERRRGAALVGLEPPRVVGVLEQPVLQVVADEEVRLADVAARDRVPRLLHERVAAVVEGDGVDDAGFRRPGRGASSPRPPSSPAACRR